MSKKRFMLRAAVYLMPLKDNQILLSRRFNTGWMDGKYSLIAGHLDGNESVVDSMIRESYEEAGLTIDSQDLIPATVLHRFSPDQEYIDFFFAAKKWQGEPRIMEPDKCDEMSWYPLDELPNEILPYIVEAINNYQLKIPFWESGWK